MQAVIRGIRCRRDMKFFYQARKIQRFYRRAVIRRGFLLRAKKLRMAFTIKYVDGLLNKLIFDKTNETIAFHSYLLVNLQARIRGTTIKNKYKTLVNIIERIKTAVLKIQKFFKNIQIVLRASVYVAKLRRLKGD
jgi:hypothetical protein